MIVANKLRYQLYRRRFRKKNKHNSVEPINIFPIDMVTIGNKTYGGIEVLMFNDSNQLYIGNYCSIGPKVTFIVSADHDYNRVSTFPFNSKILTGESEGISKGNIVVEDDVWIGYGATIMSGVRIGQGAVIAAGALVTSDIPPYSIYGGVPAKKLKMRFRQETAEYLVTLDFSKLDESMIKEQCDTLYSNLEKKTLEEIQSLLSWFPKKN